MSEEVIVITGAGYQITNCDLDVTNTNDSGPHSLRSAIECSNAEPGLDTITFNIPGMGVHTIQPMTMLPPVTDAMIIDGYSQPGSSPNTQVVGDNAVLQIEIDGSLVTGTRNILTLNVNGSTVRGLVVNKATDAAIRLNGGENKIEGNFIGTNSPGTSSSPNATFSIDINSSGNEIGGTVPASRNIISGSGNAGISLAYNGNSVQGNIIEGNYIGTDAAGGTALSGQGSGISLETNLTSFNVIGGTASGAGNLISGNNGTGIIMSGNGGGGGPKSNLVQGNLIGTDATGTVAIPNGIGIYITNEAAANTIGGAIPGARNIISGNSNGGLSLSSGGNSALGNIVKGNYIGTDITGSVALGNSSAGISISDAPDNSIGGEEPGAGNLISGNRGTGILITGASSYGNRVQGNLIGATPAGVSKIANTGNGIVLINSANDNTIGGTAGGARNIISGNNANGVSLTAGAANNKLLGNYIGTDIAGRFAIPNIGDGVLIQGSPSGSLSPNNQIGGSRAGSGNVVSGNGHNAIELKGTTATTIQGNLIGTDVSGITAIGNATGIYLTYYTNTAGAPVYSTYNEIGGLSAAERNVISGNTTYGIWVHGSNTGNVIQGNFVGTNITGIRSLGNGSAGVFIEMAVNNVIGGTMPDARNIISGNGFVNADPLNGSGILLKGVGNCRVFNNYIGTDLSGNADIGNAGNGVSLDAAAIGSRIEDNIIAYNRKNGISVLGMSVNDAIRRNSIFSNTNLGIDLGGDGVTPNDVCDADVGPNNLQNFPEITSIVRSGMNITIHGSLNSVPNVRYEIEFFSNVAGDASGNGEGQTYIGSTVVTTNGSCIGNFNFVTASVPVGQIYFSSTATEVPDLTMYTGSILGTDTSEFSAFKTFDTAISAPKPDRK